MLKKLSKNWIPITLLILSASYIFEQKYIYTLLYLFAAISIYFSSNISKNYTYKKLSLITIILALLCLIYSVISFFNQFN